jgi:hypothetical protein
VTSRILLPVAVLALTATALSLAAGRWRALAGAGAIVFALGAASLGTAAYPGPGSEFVPSTFFAVAFGMIALGAAAGLIAAIRGRGSDRMSRVAMVFASLGVALGSSTLVTLSRAAGAGAALRAMLVLAVIGVLLWFLGKTLRPGRAMIWLDRRLLDRTTATEPLTRSEVVWEMAGAALALASPWFILSCAGVLLTIIARGRSVARSTASWTRAAVLVIITGLPLVLLAQLTVRVAGNPLAGFTALQDAPFSPAFEILAGLLLLLLTWTTAGLWPLHGLGSDGPVSIAGWALLLRFGTVFVPNGVEHWRPILFLLGAVAICHTAATRRTDRALIAWGVLGTASLAAPAWWASVVMVLAGVAAWPRWPDGSAVRSFVSSQRWLLLLPAAALIPILAACLGVETASTTLATLGLVALAVGVASPSLPAHIPDSSPSHLAG